MVQNFKMQSNKGKVGVLKIIVLDHVNDMKFKKLFNFATFRWPFDLLDLTTQFWVRDHSTPNGF